MSHRRMVKAGSKASKSQRRPACKFLQYSSPFPLAHVAIDFFTPAHGRTDGNNDRLIMRL